MKDIILQNRKWLADFSFTLFHPQPTPLGEVVIQKASRVINNKNFLIKTLIILISFFVLYENNNGQNRNVKILEYQNQSLRELAEKYLGNPDYWETILQFNDIESVSELEIGMEIKIPTGLVSSTLEKMDEAKSKITNANSSGAKVLTPELISEAEINYSKVLELKQEGDWKSAYDTLQGVLKLATESLEQVRLLRESSADATISFAKGNVEKRKPIEKLWSDAELFSKLYEADRARTLSNSVAEITFIDLSRIRLNENSQALIQHSRVDVLKNITETKVKLVKGDAFVYLLKSPKKKFDVDIPGLDIKIKSKNFWIEKEKVATKIANYEGEIELSAKDLTVIVKENQGSIIPDGGVPSIPKDLLPSPELVSPENMKKNFKDNIQFNWKKISSAKQYWLELATDATFQKIVYSNKNIKDNTAKISKLLAGVYFWHICSIDELGFPGEFSNHNYFMITKDITKPFLAVVSPRNMEVTKLNSILVVGEKEHELKLYINDELIELDNDGKFSYEVQLKDGKNKIVISSLDESGNLTSITRTVFYEPSDNVKNIITNRNFIPNSNTFTINNSDFRITGITRSLSNIKFYYNKNEVSTYADTNGIYSLKLSFKNRKTILTQVIKTPAGYLKTSEFNVFLDTENPVLRITSSIPKFTNVESINLQGSVIDGDSLFINSEPIIVVNNKFEKILHLVEGENNFEIIATDVAGNRVVESILITKDSTPPKLLDYKLIRNSKNRNEYFLTVRAEDISGLTKSAIVTISVDGVEKEIILKLTNKTQYSKNIFLDESSSTLLVKFILLEDYRGNSKKYKIK